MSSNALIYTNKLGQVVQNPLDGNYIQNDPFLTLTSPNFGYSFPSSTFITLQGRKVNFQPSSLGNTTHIYSSVYYQDIIALARYFADWSCAYEIQEGALHTITVSVPWDTISNEDFNLSDFVGEQWEIIKSSDVKPLAVNGILANPFTQVSAAGNYVILPDVLKVAVQQAYDNKQSFITVPASFTGSSAPFIPYAQQILNYMRGGVEGVPSYTQTLKRTAVVDTRNSNGAFQRDVDFEHKSLNAFGTVNFVLGTYDLITRYNVNSTVATLLLPSYTKQITVTGLEPRQYFSRAGWLVKQPNFQFITRNKVQITQEFLWNEWLDGLYYINSNVSQFPLVANASSNPAGFNPHP
jgi:hypothetical protein